MNIAIPDLIAIFLSGFGILLCLVVGVQLLLRKAGMRQSNLLLGILLILYALTLSNGLFAMAGIYAQYPFLYFIPINFSLSLGPLFYFFVRSRIQPSFRLQRRHLPHFILPVLQFLFYLSIGFRSAAYKSWIWREVIAPCGQFIEEGLLIVLALGYLGAAYRMLHGVPELFWKGPVYRWLRRFNISLAFLFLISSGYEILDWVLYGFFEYNLFNMEWVAFPLKLSYAGISLLIGYHAYLYQHQSLILPEAQTKPPAEAPELSARIDALLEENKPYLDPELSLEAFAKLLGVHRNTVSKVLSSRGESFRGLVNRYRVEEFIRLVQEGQHEHLTLLAIAFESGFNSKASFNRAFKGHTGSSPTAFFQD
ncbi:MAG: AraC family transcriptional regulator [Phaeodactylibacter sp.]|uniref:helix-turn-helix domain-containing protein n=1 Tax=Phaeodactylibacter sp. TaxID=1940289 RepID=UPI0032EB930B